MSEHLSSHPAITPLPAPCCPRSTWGFTTLRNRVVMGSVHTGLEDRRDLTRIAAYVRERAEGGVGPIVTEDSHRTSPG
jgi:2,4-dienoyl-CoA reductase (NADPH2)